MITRFIITTTDRQRFILSTLIAAILTACHVYSILFMNQRFPSYTVLLGYVWLAASPLLIQYGHNTLLWFLGYIQPIMTGEDHARLKSSILDTFFSSGHLFFSIPLAPIFGIFAFKYANAAEYPLICKATITAAFALSGFMAGIGFWGIMVMGKLITRLKGHTLQLDPFSADGYGGMVYVGRFLVIGSALFFSGSLFIPFANTVFELFAADRQVILAYLAVFFYIAFGLCIYVRSILQVHDMILETKMRLDDESQETLTKLLKKTLDEDETRLSVTLKPYIYYRTHHERIAGMRTFPYDTKSLIEITATVMIPLGIFFLERLFR